MRNQKKKSGSSRKKMAPDDIAAAKYINEWALRGTSSYPTETTNSFKIRRKFERVVFEFHSHSKCSDGFLSPSAVVERAHRNGVKVLALTDHDTMAGIPEAMNVANKYGIKIIPGVEISALYCSSNKPGSSETVHILAYYAGCGPSNYDELDTVLSSIRDGRFLRAKNMLLKLNEMKKPINWENVCKIAGEGVAPGRVHVARAMVKAGHVKNIREAFSKYLYDGGPAYAMGAEPDAEVVVKLICRTGGVAVLAHPWSLKDPVSVIRSLKSAGLHAMEAYKNDKKFSGFRDLADTYELLKIGGSDYHGKGDHDESELGSINLPISEIYKFLKFARPIWVNAVKDLMLNFSQEPTESNFDKITRFGKPKNIKSQSNCNDVVDLCMSLWLTPEERAAIGFQNSGMVNSGRKSSHWFPEQWDGIIMHFMHMLDVV